MADSRGRGLEALLNKDGSWASYEVAVSSGASIGRLRGLLKRKLRYNMCYNLVIIFGGICSITEITYIPDRAAILKSENESDILQCYKGECDFKQISDTYQIPILLAPVIGMDLLAYAGFRDTKLYEMQPILDRSVVQINRFINEENEKNGLPTPNTSSCIHRCRGRNKGYRTHYNKLYDGCHPTEEVQHSWTEAIKACCKLIFQSTTDQ